MELDKRIKEGKRPLNCFDTEQAKQFIGKKCYFSDDARDFMNLDKADGDTLFYVAELQNIWTAEEYCFADNSNDYRFILPFEWVKPEEPEKKYRPYTKHEFLNKFECGKPINIRRKDDYINLFIETMPSVKIDNLSDDVHVRLFEGIFNLKRLFDEFEWQKSNGEWQPFGIKE